MRVVSLQFWSQTKYVNMACMSPLLSIAVVGFGVSLSKYMVETNIHWHISAGNTTFVAVSTCGLTVALQLAS